MSNLPPYQRGYLTSVDGVNYVSFNSLSENSRISTLTPVEVYLMLSENLDVVQAENDFSEEDRDKALAFVDAGLWSLIRR